MGYLFEDILQHQDKESINLTRNSDFADFFRMKGDESPIKDKILELFQDKNKLTEIVSNLGIHSEEDLEKNIDEKNFSVNFITECLLLIDRNIELRNIPDLLNANMFVVKNLEKIIEGCALSFTLNKLEDIKSEILSEGGLSKNSPLGGKMKKIIDGIEEKLKDPFTLDLLIKLEKILDEEES